MEAALSLSDRARDGRIEEVSALEEVLEALARQRSQAAARPLAEGTPNPCLGRSLSSSAMTPRPARFSNALG